MNREEAKNIKCDLINMFQLYNGQEVAIMWNKMCDTLFDEIEKQNKESIQKENTRLKKQLANNHNIDCMCSFCKPVLEKSCSKCEFLGCCESVLNNDINTFYCSDFTEN